MSIRLIFATVVLSLCAFFSVRCASVAKAPEAPAVQSNKPALSQAEAELRFRQIQNVSYNLKFNLNAEDPTYSGVVTMRFTSVENDKPLRIDFFEGQIQALTVNGQATAVDYNGVALNLPAGLLQKGDNEVIVQFSANYSGKGKGLMRFKDPEDQRVYLYTQLEPYFANNVFPCFDQPDLKATYEMQVQAPKDWSVVTSVRESKVAREGQQKIWHFPKSERFSTYIWSLHAGPYKIWSDSFRIPLRLMARQSLAKYVKPEEWFSVTRQGFDFFESYFAVQYPYKKYDQLVVPEFSSGAMENVAAVTFNEVLVSRGVKSENELRRQTNIILHEMAHMWFGNLVTMKWWNDLWLNESFATYVSNFAMVSSTRFKDNWKKFYDGKIGAYHEDKLVTTHPIETEIRGTQEALTNFDSITYGKGASVLKQISYYLSAEKFQKGTQIYFKRFAGKNTTLEDFTSALSEASGRDLKSWKKQWLQTAGVNSVQVDFQCEAGQIKDLSLLQTASAENPFLRSQKIQVALIGNEQGQFKVQHSIPVEISGEKTRVPAALGLKCPKIVYPNEQDHGYLQVVLDAESLKNFSADPNAVQDSFLRKMLWRDTWDLVLEAKLSLHSFAETLLQQGLAKEVDYDILGNLSDMTSGRGPLGSSVLNFYSRGSKEIYLKKAREIEEILWTRLIRAESKSEVQKILFDAFNSSVRTSFGHEKLQALLDGQVQLKGFVLDQDKRWRVINVLAVANVPKIQERIAKEEKKDSSFFGKQQALASRTAISSWDEKKKWIEEFKSEKNSYSYALIGSALSNVFPVGQEGLREQYANEFFKDLTDVNAKKEDAVAPRFLTLAPIDCSASAGPSDRIGSYLKQSAGLQPGITKYLKNLRQDFARCQKVIQKMQM